KPPLDQGLECLLRCNLRRPPAPPSNLPIRKQFGTFDGAATPFVSKKPPHSSGTSTSVQPLLPFVDELPFSQELHQFVRSGRCDPLCLSHGQLPEDPPLADP